MKRHCGAVLMAAAIIGVMLSGCSDNKGTGSFTANAEESGTIVVKAALIDALWEDVLTQLGEGFAEGEGPDASARCVAESSFDISGGSSFMIVANTNEEPTDYNSTPVIIVSSINLTLPEAGEDGRGESCGDGPLYFIIGASEDAPIDVVAGEQSASDINLEHLVASGPTAFPEGCRATVHFERHGGADMKCGPMIPIEPMPEDEDGEAEEPEPIVEPVETTSADEETTTDDEAVAEETTEEDAGEVATEETAEEEADDVAEEETAEEEGSDVTADPLDGISCENDPKLMSLKLVIDDYDCQLAN